MTALTPSKQYNNTSYNSNPLLKPAGVTYPYTEYEVQEYIKCKTDPIYFIETYVKIVTLDHGLVKMKLFDYQKKMILSFWKNKKSICLTARQAGKSTVVAAFFVWYTLFNPEKVCAILANKAVVAREILSRYQKAYENIPKFLQQGVVTFNKGTVELENGSKIMAASTSSSAIRGFTISVLYLDEYAFVHPNVAEEFFTSVWPTLSSGKDSKIIVTSTPNGFNHYYKMWIEAEQNINGFNHIFVHWSDVPGRDQKWKEEQLKVLGENKFAQEMDAEFLGSSNTLIPSKYIRQMAAIKPSIILNENIKIFEYPIKKDVYIDSSKDHTYLIVCDPSRGTGNDSTAFIIFDVTDYPIKIAATFQDNQISPLALPGILEKIGKKYNNAWILVEVNDNGQQVADVLWNDYEYENMVILSKKSNKDGKIGGNIIAGVRTTKLVKRLGCSTFRDMIEMQKLNVTDSDLISEISTFIAKKGSYEAEIGCYDDLVMCCVLLAWYAQTQDFRNITDTNFKHEIIKQRMEILDEQHLPLGFFDNGLSTQFDEPDPFLDGWFDF